MTDLYTEAVTPSKFRKIVWLASYPKSGNTWLRAFLTSYINKEKVHANNIMNGSDADEKMYSKFAPVKDIAVLSCEDLIAIKPAVILAHIASYNGERLLLKSHDANIDVQHHYLIPSLFTLGAVYIIRDPRDVAKSLSYHVDVKLYRAVSKLLDKRSALAMNKGVHQLHQVTTSWNVHVNSWTIGTLFPVCLVRYEDMSRQPEEAFQKILTYLQLAPDKKAFKKAMKETKFGRLQLTEKKNGFKEKRDNSTELFFRKGKVGSWQTELPKHLVYKIEEQCHVNMEKFGYKLSRPFGKYRYEQPVKCHKHSHYKKQKETYG